MKYTYYLLSFLFILLDFYALVFGLNRFKTTFDDVDISQAFNIGFQNGVVYISLVFVLLLFAIGLFYSGLKYKVKKDKVRG